MSIQAVPTKGNLMNTKKSLSLAKTGYELLDKKRNILIREMMLLIDEANKLQNTIDDAYAKAYLALQTANLTHGYCGDICNSTPIEDTLQLSYRSVMGVEIPKVTIEQTKTDVLYFGLHSTDTSLDDAYQKFTQVKILTAKLAEIENSVYRLADAIKKTQKRANALKNIMIPKLESTVNFITNALDEKEREEFSRLKVIKNNKTKENKVV